ncbi:hypothetical protein MASR2M44_10360 [Bacteroidota bacterium]
MTFTKKWIFILLAIAHIPMRAFSQEVLFWADEFNGNSLDTSYWEYQIGDGCPNLCGWGNNELQSYQKSQLKVENGLLMIQAKKQSIGNSSYVSSRIRTINKLDFAGGRIEVRARMPKGKGYWPAVWFLPTENYFGQWPMSGEIDLLEGKGQEPTKTWGTIHYGSYAPQNKYSGETYTLPSGNFTDDFHTFTVIWKPDSIKWYVNGQLFATRTPKDLGGYNWPFRHNFHPIINLAVGGNFLGNPDGSTPDTATLQVDYIRIYQAPEHQTISGPEAVLRYEKGRKFYVNSFPGSTYNWMLPSGASLVSGAGTPAVVVNWGLKSDSLKVEISRNGSSYILSKWVNSLPDTCGGLIDNGEDLNTMLYAASTGTFRLGTTNPAKDSVNNTNACYRYYRNATQAYDNINWRTDLIKESESFEKGNLVLRMKVYTTAPIGTEINLNFENRQRAQADYPSGRRSVFQAKTTRTRAWEQLEFKRILTPDLQTPANSIDQLVMLPAPNSSNNDVFFFDEFSLLEKPCKDAANALGEQLDDTELLVYPNPVSTELNIQSASPIQSLELLEISGKSCGLFSTLEQLNQELIHTTPGLYVLLVRTENSIKTFKLRKE